MDPFDELIDCTKKACLRVLSQINNAELYVKVARTHWKKPNLYKTEICDHWRNKRKCNYGVRCWYAHGPQELRSSSSCAGTSTTDSTSPEITTPDSPMPLMQSTDGPLSIMAVSDPLGSQQHQLSIMSSAQSAPPPYAAVQHSQVPQFSRIGAISFSNGFNISTNGPAPFNQFASSGFNYDGNRANVAPFNFASSGFNFGASGLNFNLSNPFNFASSSLNFGASGLNFGDLKFSRMNIWD